MVQKTDRIKISKLNFILLEVDGYFNNRNLFLFRVESEIPNNNLNVNNCKKGRIKTKNKITDPAHYLLQKDFICRTSGKFPAEVSYRTDQGGTGRRIRYHCPY